MRLFVSCLLFALVAALLTPISASAQNAAFCTALYDANGSRLGQAVQADSVTTLLLNQNGRIVRLDATPFLIQGNASVYFTEADCTGDAYMLFGQIQPLAGKDSQSNDVWYQDTVTMFELIDTESERYHGGTCVPNLDSRTKIPALHMTLPTFTPPFHLEPESCFTPNPAVAALTPYGLGAMAFVLAFGAYLMVRRPQAA
jgi:hypothetical protein